MARPSNLSQNLDNSMRNNVCGNLEESNFSSAVKGNAFEIREEEEEKWGLVPAHGCWLKWWAIVS